MTPTVQDLRAALREMADEHPAPAPRDLLADLRAERTRRRRGRAALGVAAASAVVVAAAAAMQVLGAGDASPAPPPAEGTGSPVDRGWSLEDGAPPEQADGLLHLSTVEVDYTGPEEVTLPRQEGTQVGDQRFAVLWCDVGPDDDAITRPSLRLSTAEGAAVEVPCLPEDDGRTGTPVTPVPLPPGDVVVEPAWEGDVPSRGSAVLGIYREASWSEYAFPGLPDPAVLPPSHGKDATVIGPKGASAPGQDGYHPDARTVTVTLTGASSLELWRGTPGRLEVTVDGVRVSDDGDGTADGAWRDADPELRDGAWAAFTAGQRRSRPLPPEVLPGYGKTRTVTVTVVPRAGAEHWQVAVLGTADAAATARPSTAAEGDTVDLPAWHAGHRLLATWQVPSTGVATELELPVGLAEDGTQVAWALRCAASGDGVLGTARITVDGSALERVCTPGLDQALHVLYEGSGAGASARPEVGPGSTVQVAVPAAADGGEALVAAYVPVPFEEFDFAAAEAPPAFDPLAAVRGGVVVERTVRSSALTDGAAVELPVDPATRGVRVTTEGVGRLRFLLDGEPVEGLGVDDEGWWTSWTDDRATALPAVWIQGPARSGVLSVEVDGYADGSVGLEMLVADDQTAGGGRMTP